MSSLLPNKKVGILRMALFKKLENKRALKSPGNVRFLEFWIMSEAGIPLCHRKSPKVKGTMDQNLVTSFFSVFQHMLRRTSHEELENIKFKNSKLIISDANVQFELYFMARVNQKYKDGAVRRELEKIGEKFIIQHWDDLNDESGFVGAFEDFPDLLDSYF